MPSPKRTIFLKQSGESLCRGAKNGERYTAEGLNSVAESIAAVYQNRKTLGVSGITVVLGAGNLIRGNEIKDLGVDSVSRVADAGGRLAIAINATYLGAALEALNVPIVKTLPHSMGYWDTVASVSFEVYDRHKVLEYHAAGKVVIAAGGSGMDGRSSDYAVVHYAQPFAEIFDGQVTVLKSTKYDGVYASDPAKNHSPRHYKVISAKEMLADYDNFSALDQRSLELLDGSDFKVHVYAESKHELTDVLAHESTDPAQTTIGTIIVGKPCKAEFYN